MAKLIIEANRNGYAPDQCGETMTVGELIATLQENYDEADRIYLSHDSGYTYGSLTERDLRVDEDEDENEE